MGFWLTFLLGVCTGCVLGSLLVVGILTFRHTEEKSSGESRKEFLLRDIAEVEYLLSKTPKTRYLERIPLERRLEDHRKELQGITSSS